MRDLQPENTAAQVRNYTNTTEILKAHGLDGLGRVVVRKDDASALSPQIACAASSMRISANAPFPATPLSSKRRHGEAHIFVDNSNLVVGARHLQYGTRDTSVHLDIAALARVLERDLDTVVERMVAGSNMPAHVKSLWAGQGYTVKEGVCSRGRGETFVDEALHSSISRAIFDTFESGSSPAPTAPDTQPVLVLGTGDGNDREGTNSFPRLARAAARMGWHVIIYAWMPSTSPRFYEVQREYPSQIEVRKLDCYEHVITYRRVPVNPMSFKSSPETQRSTSSTSSSTNNSPPATLERTGRDNIPQKGNPERHERQAAPRSPQAGLGALQPAPVPRD